MRPTTTVVLLVATAVLVIGLSLAWFAGLSCLEKDADNATTFGGDE